MRPAPQRAEAPAGTPVLWVLDTNVVLDLIYWNDAGVAPLAAALQCGAAVACVDEPCLKELETVLARPEFLGDPQQARQRAAAFRAAARVVSPGSGPALPPLPRCRDPEDQKFLELARTSGAELLVTRDKALLALARRKHRLSVFRIVTPDAAARLCARPAAAQ
jgi:putative PIN family toxin of toxin-antitoxin system